MRLTPVVPNLATAPADPARADPYGGAYRRKARRLRCRFAGRPEALQHSLRALAREHDARDPHRTHPDTRPRASRRPDFSAPGRSADAAGLTRVMAKRVSVKSFDERPQGQRSGPSPTSPDGDERAVWFTDHVGATVDGSPLRYSQRLALLHTAARLGISRFEANLIIAAVQHRGPPEPAEAGEAPAKGTPQWLRTLVTVAAIQSALGAAAWWVVAG